MNAVWLIYFLCCYLQRSINQSIMNAVLLFYFEHKPVFRFFPHYIYFCLWDMSLNILNILNTSPVNAPKVAKLTSRLSNWTIWDIFLESQLYWIYGAEILSIWSIEKKKHFSNPKVTSMAIIKEFVWRLL